MQAVWDFPLSLPRHAFSPREVARAGDVWRSFQEAAVEASSNAGWPPSRYREVGNAFIMRSMTVVHHREAVYGAASRARTWVSRFRRDMFSTRQVRLFDDDGAIASGQQEWVHVSMALEPLRAGPELLTCFPVHDEGDPVTMPELEAADPSKTTTFGFDCWQTWTDPLHHANHPAYVDWFDEAISRALVDAGGDPVLLVPVAESVFFKSAVGPGDPVTIETTLRGRTSDGDVALSHRILARDGVLCADATSIRRLAGRGGDELAACWS